MVRASRFVRGEYIDEALSTMLFTVKYTALLL